MDGDTIAVMRDGTYTKVRIIGINSPEIYADTKPAQCYGQEAAQEAHRMLDGSSVSLTTDPTQDTYDKYGRLLAYITLTDDSDFGAYMVTNGFAREYTYRVAYQRQKTYRAAQASAQQSRAGLWGRCAQ
jgi:micrococcal nuclease